MNTYLRFVVLVLGVSLLLSSCDLFDFFGADDTSGLVDQAPVLSFTPAPPEVTGTQSRAVVSGSIAGEEISIDWDFRANEPDDDSNASTNGAMFVQASSAGIGGVSIALDNDFGTANVQGEADWYVRFTLGNAQPLLTVYNAKTTFSVPQDRSYSMITVRKGPSGTEYKHTEHDTGNRTTGILTQWAYESTPGTERLRVAGALRSEWNGGTDWIQIDFSVLLAGPDDRNFEGNRNNLAAAF